MIWGGAATLLGLVIPALGRLVGWVAWVFLTHTIEVVGLTARIPRASVPVHMEGWMVWGYYGLLAGVTWWLSSRLEAKPPVAGAGARRLAGEGATLHRGEMRLAIALDEGPHWPAPPTICTETDLGEGKQGVTRHSSAAALRTQTMERVGR